MSLNIYTDRSEIPNGMDFIDYNDIFFNGIALENNELNRRIMMEIDKAQYASSYTFIGRDKYLGNINKEHLSTGCKTLLNIANNPDKCFDVIECGQNALSLLPLFKEGNILWGTPILHFVGEANCDIVIDNRNFTDFREFLKYVMD